MPLSPVLSDFRVDETPEAWERLADCSHASPLSRYAWVRAGAEILGGTPIFLTVMQGDSPLAGCATIQRRRYGLPYAPPVPLSTECGFLACVHDIDRLRPAMLILASRVERMVHTAVIAVPEALRWSVEQRRGWVVRTQQDLVLDMHDDRPPWEEYRQSHRRKCRVALREGAQVLEKWDVDRLLVLFSASYSAHGIRPPYPMEIMRALVAASRKSGARMFFLITNDGVAHAARLILTDGHTGYDLVAGDDRATSIPRSHALVHEVLGILHGEGVRRFDFGGGNTEGIRDFKLGFGAHPVSRPEARWVGSPVMRVALEFRHRWLLRLRRLV